VDLSEIQVTVINRSHRILKEIDEDLANYAMDTMTKHHVQFKFGATVQEIHRDRAILTNGETLSTHTVIWCAGIAPNPLNRKASLPLDERGYILCERTLRVKGYDHVWAVGDCAINLDPDGHHYPFTAQHAVKEGTHLAGNLVRVLKEETPEPCNIRYLGSLAMIGHHAGVAKILNLKFSGHLAWFLYRMVYLVKIPGWMRRTRVALDWTLDIFFPRDNVQLGVRESKSR
jgi:NADH:ubiquinone reductase (H+-translocating)